LPFKTGQALLDALALTEPLSVCIGNLIVIIAVAFFIGYLLIWFGSTKYLKMRINGKAQQDEKQENEEALSLPIQVGFRGHKLCVSNPSGHKDVYT
jgi:hypothetical protein